MASKEYKDYVEHSKRAICRIAIEGALYAFIDAIRKTPYGRRNVDADAILIECQKIIEEYRLKNTAPITGTASVVGNSLDFEL